MRLRSQASRGIAPLEAPLDDHATIGRPMRPEAGRIDTRDLSREERERVAEYQARTGASLADALVDLGLVSPEAVHRALAELAPSGLIDPDATGVSRAVVAAYDPTDPLVLKLRALRSTLFSPDDLRGAAMRIFVLAGIGTQDGAGIAANLAVLVAQLGVRGLLVDANFTAPTQHNLFGLADGDGVTSLLTGSDASVAAILDTPVPNLDLLPAGPEIPTLSETVERASLVTRLRAIRPGYDFAIIDAGDQAPEIVAALSRGADGVLLVAERERTPMESVQTLLRRLEANDIPVIGTVLAR